MAKPVVLYARLSVSRDESVSIARQLEAGRDHAAREGWTVLAEFIDRGVSATTARPEQRPGWSNLLAFEEHYEAVIAWKIDRIARRTLDFLHADRKLQERGAGIVTVGDKVDMTTDIGSMSATIMATFAEQEAKAIASRVREARRHLVRAGRVVGGTVPYGWRKAAHPGGAGYVLEKDPQRIVWVEAMVERALRGDSLYSIKKWLDAEGAPLPEKSQKNRKRDGWAYSTVERLLRSPVLAGMTPHQPGRARHAPRDPSAVLRDDSGMPVVNEAIALITPAERIKLLEVLDGRESPQARPRASRGATSPFLSGLAKCGDCDRTMQRGTTGRPVLKCPGCHQTIARRQLDDHLTERLLTERGDLMMLKSQLVNEGRQERLVELEAALQDLARQFAAADDDDKSARLQAQIQALKAERTAARTARPAQTYKVTGKTVAGAWSLAGSEEERRAVLASQLQSLTIVRGRTGRNLDTARVRIEWLPVVKAGPFKAAAPQ